MKNALVLLVVTVSNYAIPATAKTLDSGDRYIQSSVDQCLNKTPNRSRNGCLAEAADQAEGRMNRTIAALKACIVKIAGTQAEIQAQGLVSNLDKDQANFLVHLRSNDNNIFLPTTSSHYAAEFIQYGRTLLLLERTKHLEIALNDLCKNQ